MRRVEMENTNYVCDHCGREVESYMEIPADLNSACICQLQQMTKNLVEFINDKTFLLGIIARLEKVLPPVRENFNMI